MLEQTYFTFEETKPINYYHNDRTQPPKQLLENANYDKALFKKSADIECNRSAEDVESFYKKLFSESKENYYAVKHRHLRTTKAHKYSAVVKIKENTTMQDIEKLVNYFETKFSWQCLQIAIHRDEEHIDKETNEVKINHHAHLEFFTLDKYGINCFVKNRLTQKLKKEIIKRINYILRINYGYSKKHITKKEKKEKTELEILFELDVIRAIERYNYFSEKKRLARLERDNSGKYVLSKEVRKRIDKELKLMGKVKIYYTRVFNSLKDSVFKTKEDLETAINILHKEINYIEKEDIRSISELKFKLLCEEDSFEEINLMYNYLKKYQTILFNFLKSKRASLNTSKKLFKNDRLPYTYYQEYVNHIESKNLEIEKLTQELNSYKDFLKTCSIENLEQLKQALINNRSITNE